jgi:hypothetical protein
MGNQSTASAEGALRLSLSLSIRHTALRFGDNPPVAVESPRCPVCGDEAWEEAPQRFVLRESNPQILRGGGIEVTGSFCARCGFVRLHRVDEAGPPFGGAAS